MNSSNRPIYCCHNRVPVLIIDLTLHAGVATYCVKMNVQNMMDWLYCSHKGPNPLWSNSIKTSSPEFTAKREELFKRELEKVDPFAIWAYQIRPA